MNIILAHGFLGFREKFGIEYFNGVQAHLQVTFGANVLVPEVPPLAGIRDRGGQLRQQILAAFEDRPGIPRTLDSAQPTHIIAHSMGGLDSRFILSLANPQNIAGRITSLTTIATPHRGSPVADVVLAGLDGQLLAPHEKILQELVVESLIFLRIPLEGLRDLTTAACQQFNQAFPDNPRVRYFSVAGQGRRNGRQTSLALFPAYKLLKLRAPGEENDGEVTVSSATWGQFDANLWLADHTEEVGHDLDRVGQPGAFDHLAHFDALVRQLP